MKNPPFSTDLLDAVGTGIVVEDFTAVLEQLERLRAIGLVSVSAACERDQELAGRLFDSIQVVWANDAAVQIFRADGWDSLAEQRAATFLPESRTAVFEILEALYREREAVELETVRCTLRRERVWLRIYGRLIARDGGAWMVQSLMDNTAQRAAFQEALDVRARYETAFRNTEVGTWQWNLTRRTLDCDEEAHRVLGYYAGEISPTLDGVLSLIHPEDRRETELQGRRCESGIVRQFAVDHRLRRRDGSYSWIASRGQVCEWQDGRPHRAIGTLRDISAEHNHRAYLELEKQIFSASAAGTPVEAMLDDLCLGLEAILSNSLAMVILLDQARTAVESVAAPSMTPRFREVVQTSEIDQLCGGVQTAIRAGQVVMLSDLRDDPALERYQSALDGFPARGAGVMPIVSSDAVAIGAIAILSPRRGAVEFDAVSLNRVAQAVAMVSERERNAGRQRLLQSQMQNRQRFESLGILAGGVAHDFNNLLLAIVSNAELIRLQQGLPSAVAESVDQIEHAAMVAAGLCKQMLTYAGKVEAARVEFDVVTLIEEISALVRSACANRVEIHVECTATDALITGDRSSLSQVFLNLLTNAADAIERVGEIRVRVFPTTLTFAQFDRLVFGYTGTEGSFLAVEVRDDGCGMEPSTQERIFDPFYTTKTEGRGLGLASVLGILERHEACIRLQSTPGQGTAMTVCFPLKTASAPMPAGEPTLTEAPSPRVLVVDDHDSVRLAVARSLEAEGVDVVAVRSGTAALGVLDGDRRFQVVLLDQRMPGLSGLETYGRIRELDGRLRVCFMTGYAASAELENVVRIDQRADLLRKPFQRDELLEAVKGGSRS